jgi:glutamyl-Q tRNA(Asp) synthetase
VTQPVFRFAPSPNGRLHLGHAYSALTNAALAARFGGRLLLRIEDIDTTRCRPEFEAAIYEDLAWLGLRWEEPVRRQSDHFGEYRAAAERLKGRGLLYPCFCSRKDIAAAVAEREARLGAPWPVDPDGTPLYPGTCRARSDRELRAYVEGGEAHAWRIDMTAALAAAPGRRGFVRFEPSGAEKEVPARPERWGDVVLVRKEIPTSYHLAVVLDDALQAVTHVVRGRELEPATDLHVLLQRLFELAPPRYHHHALIRDEVGHKLAKSRGSQTLADLRARGLTAAAIRHALGFGA